VGLEWCSASAFRERFNDLWPFEVRVLEDKMRDNGRGAPRSEFAWFVTYLAPDTSVRVMRVDDAGRVSVVGP